MNSRLFGLIPVILLSALTGCSKVENMKYRKQIQDIGYFSSYVHNPDGTPARDRLRIEINEDFSCYVYHTIYGTTHNNYKHCKFEGPIKMKFTYQYYYGNKSNLTVNTESVDAVAYKIIGFLNEESEQAYFLFGYNNPQVFFANETVNNDFIEKNRTLDYAINKDGEEVNIKSFPDFRAIQLTHRGAKDAEWEKGNII